jgi:ATP-dependent exoDNAse (exonuclease V) alpha subunit
VSLGTAPLRATHRRTKKAVTLPAAYVQDAVELGYATTIHTVQGVTADTTHGLVDELMTASSSTP